MKNFLIKTVGIVFVMLALMTSIQANTCVAETITLDSNVSSAWSTDCNLTQGTTVKYEKVYTFTLADTEAIGIDVTSNNQDVELELYNDINGTLNLLNSSQPLWQGEGITRMLEVGTYTIKVLSEQLNSFTLSLADLPTVDMHFSGSIIIPSSLQDVYDNCSGDACPTMTLNVEGYNYIHADANITYNSANTTYDYNLTYNQIVPDDEIDNNYRVFIRIKNGDMGAEVVYYSFGADNAIGTDTDITDSNDTLMHNTQDEDYNDIYIPLNIPLAQTDVNLDIDLSHKNDGRQKIIGKVKLPSNIIELVEPNGIDFNNDFINIWISELNTNNGISVQLTGTPDANGTYDFITSLDYGESNTGRYKIQLYGRLDGLFFNTIYYQIAEDANDSNDHAIDGDEKFISSAPAFDDYVEFNNTVGDLGTLDIDAYFSGFVMLRGVVTPPVDFIINPTSPNNIGLSFSSGVNTWYVYIGSWSTEVNGSYAYGIRISEEQQASIELDGLSLDLSFYSGGSSSQYSYSFGDDRDVGGTGANLDHVVTDSVDAPQSLLIDFNATVPNVDINLSSFVLPATGDVVVFVSTPYSIVGNVNVVAHDVDFVAETPITAWYDVGGQTLHGLKEGHNYAIEISYEVNGQFATYMLNDNDGNFTNGGVFLEEARYITNTEGIQVLDTATIAGGIDMTLSPFDFILPNQIIFEGNVILPESITGLVPNCEGEACPVVSVYIEHVMDAMGVSQAVQLPSGSYSMGISPMTAPTTKDENAYRVRVEIRNGNMGDETFYYNFGTDNAIGNVNNVMDGNDSLSRNWIDSTVKLDLNQTNVNLDINLTNKDEGRQIITGKIKLPIGMSLGYDMNTGQSNGSLNVQINDITDVMGMNSAYANVSQTPDANGLYAFTTSVNYDAAVGTKLTLSLNGDLNGTNVNLYYQIGADSNDTDDHSIDGDEKLVSEYPSSSNYAEFNTSVADYGTIDMEAYYAGSATLTGMFTPPATNDANYEYATLRFTSTNDVTGESVFSHNIHMDLMMGTGTQDFSIFLPQSVQAGIAEHNLSLSISYGGVDASTPATAYSFEVPNRLLNAGEDASNAVPLVLDFNATLPVLDIDLSNTVPPEVAGVTFTGNVILPTSITDLMATCITECPSISVEATYLYSYMSRSSNVELNVTSGQYEYEVKIPTGTSSSVQADNNYQIRVGINNGNMGDETFYYNFGTDNAIGNVNNVMDGNDSLSREEYTIQNLNLDLNQTEVALDINLTNKDEGRQQITGKIKLPAGTTLGDNGDGTWNSLSVNIVPVVYDEALISYIEDAMPVPVQLSQTPDENGSYIFTGSVSYDDTIGSRLKLSLSGELNGENINLYYDVGMDANGSYDFTIDGNEELVSNYLPATSHVHFTGVVADFGEISLETYLNSSTLLTGTFTPPSDAQDTSITLEFISTDGAGFLYEVNKNFWIIQPSDVQNFSIRIPNDKYAGIEENNLSLNINFGSQTRAYSFGAENRMLSDDENASDAIPLVLDFNASMPVLNIDLSNYATPGRQQITGKIKLPAGTTLGDNGDGTWNSLSVNIMPVTDDGMGNYMDYAMPVPVQLSQTPDENGSYIFTGSVDYDDTIGSRLKLSLSGELNGENINLYYDVGMDANGSYDFTIDGNEELVSNYLPATSYVHFTGAVADFGVVDIAAYYIANDHIAPVITLIGDNPQNLERGTVYVELNATTDDGSAITIDSSAVDMSVADTYIVTYNAVDISGNIAQEVNRTIIVEDTIAPAEPTIVSDTETIESNIIIEVHGEVGTEVYINDINVTRIGINGGVNIELPLVVGTNTFEIKLVDIHENESTVLTVEILRLLDTDGDGIADRDDNDDDNDGVLDYNDDLPLNANESVDTDGDGIGNNADNDDDNDGISDTDEIRWGFDPLDASDGRNADADVDGVSNADEIEAGSSPLDPNDTKKPKRFIPILMDDLIIMIPKPE